MRRSPVVFGVLVVAGLLCACATPEKDALLEKPAAPDLAVSLGDLDSIRERGVLRVIAPALRESHLPRRGTPDALDRELARRLARRLGVRAEFIVIESRTDLLELLERGFGDMVTAQLTITEDREKRVRFTQPTASVSEWLVGSRHMERPPRSLEELDGREVHVRASSAFATTLSELSASAGLDVTLVPLDERLDTESIAYEVSQGRLPLTVMDSNLLDSVETYNDDLERLFVLAEGRQLAWAVRKDAPELLAAVDIFIVEHFLTEHRTDDLTTGGLAEILERGSLRVLTLNNPVNYFLYRGRMMGFDYEVAKLAARRLDVRLEMVVAPRHDLIFDWLLRGRGDVIASTLTVTPERQDVFRFSRPYLFIEELVVQAASTTPLTDIRELAGREIHAWRSSSHYQTLVGLMGIIGDFTIVPVPEEMEAEEILSRVATGEYPLAVVDSHILKGELRFRDDVVSVFPLRDPREVPAERHTVVARDKAVAFALRPNNPELAEFMDGFVSDIRGTLNYNVARRRYFEDNRRLARVKEHRASVSGRLSPYDAIFKRYANQYGLDWRLMVAMAYQESRFDPNAKSWTGAQGVFQLMPLTARELGFEELSEPEVGIHAGVKYVSQLFERIDPSIDLKHRLRFAVAGYNAGWGHVEDARRLADEKGWDPDKWFGHTERAILLLAEPAYYRHARHGYVRGIETMRYVSQIQNLYDHYVTLVPP